MLVKSHEVYLTDFGTTLDWSDTNHDTTTGLASKFTLRYSAPEVATNQPRNASADIWSLGCVFLEIWTELCHHSVIELNSFMKDHGTKSCLYYANIPSVIEWCDMLSSGTNNDAKVPGPWIRSMLEVDASARCSIQSLTEEIQLLNFGSDVADSFSGLCCNGGYIVAETVFSSRYQASISGSKKSVAALSQSSSKSIPSSSEKKSDSTKQPSVTSPSSRYSRISRPQVQKWMDTIHEGVESADHPDRLPVVDERLSELQSRSSVPKVLPTLRAIGPQETENATLSPNWPREMFSAKSHKTDGTSWEVVLRGEPSKTHNATSPSKATHSHHAQSALTSLFKQAAQNKAHAKVSNTRYRSPVLQLPSINDKRTVNELLRQWLYKFEPSAYRKIMSVEVSSRPSSCVDMYLLEEDEEEVESSLLYRFSTEYRDRKNTWKLVARFQRVDPGGLTMNLVEDTLHVMNSISVPWVEYEDGFACFYPEGILPKYGNDGTTDAQALESFELLQTMRPQLLQWWHDFLSAPQYTWGKKLRETRMFEVFLVVKAPKKYYLRMEELHTSSRAQDFRERLEKDRDDHSNIYRHIHAAIHHCCRLRLQAFADITPIDRAIQRYRKGPRPRYYVA